MVQVCTFHFAPTQNLTLLSVPGLWWSNKICHNMTPCKFGLVVGLNSHGIKANSNKQPFKATICRSISSSVSFLMCLPYWYQLSKRLQTRLERWFFLRLWQKHHSSGGQWSAWHWHWLRFYISGGWNCNFSLLIYSISSEWECRTCLKCLKLLCDCLRVVEVDPNE